jgi:hypothetical protein
MERAVTPSRLTDTRSERTVEQIVGGCIAFLLGFSFCLTVQAAYAVIAAR